MTLKSPTLLFRMWPFKFVVAKAHIYDRSHDFGQALGVGGYLKSLCRTAIGNHNLSDSITIETFEKNLYASS